MSQDNSATTIKKSYQEIAEFDGNARRWLSQNQENTKFKYAVERVLKRSQTILTEYNEKLQEISIENCAEDKDGIILTDDRGQFKFTKEGLRKKNKAQSKLWHEAAEIEPYYAEPPADFDAANSDLFMYFVLKEPVSPAVGQESK